MATRNTTHAQRVKIIEWRQTGKTLETIAADMNFNFYTVRKWWRVYRLKGWDGLAPRPPGSPPNGDLSEFDDLVKYVALRLKREHPAWGLDVLLLHTSRHPSLVGKRCENITYSIFRPYARHKIFLTRGNLCLDLPSLILVISCHDSPIDDSFFQRIREKGSDRTTGYSSIMNLFIFCMGN